MAKETLLMKLKRFNEAVDNNISDKMSPLKRLATFLDFTYEYKVHEVYLLDYIQYGFYWKTKPERKKYVVHGKLIEMMKKCNSPEHRFIFDEKPEFDKAFSKFLHRDWLDFKYASYDDFVSFLQGKDTFFIKDPKGMFGKGVSKVLVSEIKDVKNYYEDLVKKQVLCEETLTQCKEMAEFNDTSINTLRVVSMVKKNGEVEIMGGLLRVGRQGRIADNFHHQGIAAFIDPKSGVVVTTGIDKDNIRHVYHPDSNKQIVGFNIPIWDEVIRTVEEAALVYADMRYIGWDVVIDKNYNVVLVEGNPGADPDAEQITTKEGRWPLYKRIIDEL